MSLEHGPWLWLCVVPDPPPGGQTRTYWTVTENRVAAVADDDDQFWLGVSDPAQGHRSRSAADRVAALFRRAATPEYTLPVLTREMIAAIFQAFAPARRDRFPAAAPAHLLRFLLAHRGGIAFVRETEGPPDGGEYNEELNRLMRASAASQPRGVSVTRLIARRPDDEDDEPGDGGDGGVREPRRPLPGPPPIAAAVGPDDDQP